MSFLQEPQELQVFEDFKITPFEEGLISMGGNGSRLGGMDGVSWSKLETKITVN
jgi:hypothetical protein